MKKLIPILLLIMLAATNLYAQDVNINELPEYVVVTSENTKILGGININIAHKKSNYEKALKELESTLQNVKKLRVRTQTDLLNAMSKLGFDYIDAYNANAGAIGAGAGDKIQLSDTQAKFRTNMVFRKKEELRDPN